MTRVHSIIRNQLGLLVTSLMATAYSITFSYFAVQTYNSFRATWFDLGIETQVLWLTLHGGYPAYVQSGQNAIYTFPFTRLSYILVLPIYAAIPNPATLLVAESFLLGFAAIPLFYLARKLLRGEVAAIFVVGAYLLSFDIQGANLFDYHPENLFPLVFFTAIAAWVYGRRLIFLVTVAAGSLIDPLVSLTLFLFLLQLLAREVWYSSPRTAEPGVISAAKRRARQIIQVARRDYHVTGALIILLAANAIAFYVSAATGELTHSPSGIAFTVAGFSSESQDKLIYLFTLLGPLVFLFLLDPLFTIVISGFVVYVLALSQPDPILIFGGAYPVIILPPLFAAAIFGIYRLSSGCQYITSSRPPQGGGVREYLPRLDVATHRRRARRLAEVLAISGLAFALLFSPLSFYEPNLTYDGSSGPQSVYQLTSGTAAGQFLQQVVSLVPETGSVLTQNNIPQLSGRFQATTFDVAPAGLQPSYVLADSAVNYYSNFQVALPWLEGFLQSGNYGIVAQGQGAILLEKGFTGKAILFDPLVLALNASQFDVFNGSQLTGGIIVHYGSNGPAQYVWYGPYALLPPGNYTASFSIRAFGNGPPNGTVITLDVLSGMSVYSSESISLSTFGDSGDWIQVNLSFQLPNYTSRMEFRGVNAASNATIEFSGAVVSELAA